MKSPAKVHLPRIKLPRIMKVPGSLRCFLLLIIDVLFAPLLSGIAADTVVPAPPLQSQGLEQLLYQEALELV